ncbi:hypothetical protein [Ktedonobacter robiniae]|uniref:Uncharacterized protein n=1 Tax=Ktedonobacter robiniae TaxID=2778365 RepID=A0ABQ3URV9_9CHLR|nr:hypothetical protein [Ktedonobacter robiniae]GHO55478.1 hypothetical protein KSB_39530 [Ktedonobacter robiniae]
MKIWFQAKGADILAFIGVVIGIVLLFGAVSLAALALIHTNNLWLQTIGVLLLMAEFAAFLVLVSKD